MVVNFQHWTWSQYKSVLKYPVQMVLQHSEWVSKTNGMSIGLHWTQPSELKILHLEEREEGGTKILEDTLGERHCVGGSKVEELGWTRCSMEPPICVACLNSGKDWWCWLCTTYGSKGGAVCTVGWVCWHWTEHTWQAKGERGRGKEEEGTQRRTGWEERMWERRWFIWDCEKIFRENEWREWKRKRRH